MKRNLLQLLHVRHGYGRRGKLFSLLVLAACAGAYSTDIGNIVEKLTGDDGNAASMIKDIPQNASETIDYVKKKLGDPKENFQSGMDGMINVARDFNPNVSQHPSYENIYESMDEETFLELVKKGDI